MVINSEYIVIIFGQDRYDASNNYRVRYLLSATMYYRTLNLLDRQTNQLTFSTNL